MYRKILMAALLCLGLSQTANAQYTTAEAYLANTVNTTMWQSVQIVRRVDFPMAVDAAYNYFVVDYFFYTRSGSNVVNFYFNTGTAFLRQSKSNSVISQASTMPIAHPVTGVIINATPTLDLSKPEVMRVIYTRAQIGEWATVFNAAIATYPQTSNELFALGWASYGGPSVTYTFSGLNSAARSTAYITRDYDQGGMQDWDEIFYGAFPGLNFQNPQDDVACYCNPCCSCECICGGRQTSACDGRPVDCDCHKPPCICGACCSCKCTCEGRWLVICDGTETGCSCHAVCTCGACCSCTCSCGKWNGPLCGGGRSDCWCHNICVCSACCSCTCICGYNWGDAVCGGGRNDCACHNICTCGACCSCECTCGYEWLGNWCNGTPSGCDCHKVCTCGACCSCRCTCGFWKGEICEGRPGECVCHSCICGACCSCKCTCGQWSGPQCNGTPSGCVCHKVCVCGACCSCWCVCGQWTGPVCNGSPMSCSCHACSCNVCCSCKCVCGNWQGRICSGRAGDCSCHYRPGPNDPTDPEQCTCGACCSCKCVCGKWHLQFCPKTPDACPCHAPIEGADWFPAQELVEAFENLHQRLKTKLGVDVEAVFQSVQGSQFTQIRIEVPKFLVSGVPSSYITFNLEDLRQYEIVSLIRMLFLAVLFITLIQVILVILRQY